MQLPNKVRTKPESRTAEETFRHTMSLAHITHDPHMFKHSILNKEPRVLLAPTDLQTMFPNVFDWHFAFLGNPKGSSDLRIFIGMYYFSLCLLYISKNNCHLVSRLMTFLVTMVTYITFI